MPLFNRLSKVVQNMPFTENKTRIFLEVGIENQILNN
jgi:hypothetical protein